LDGVYVSEKGTMAEWTSAYSLISSKEIH
jgi:hypothetical protein